MLVATVGEGIEGLRELGIERNRDGGTEGREEKRTEGRRDEGTKGSRDREATRSHVMDEVVLGLRAKLEEHRRSQARRAGWTRRVVPMGLVRIDARLPGGGLPCGAITEILSDGPGAGSMTLAMRVGREKGSRDQGIEGSRDNGSDRSHRRIVLPPLPSEGMGHPRKIVVVDVCGDFYPPAVVRHGVSLDRIIVIRTTNEQDAFWAVDQSLRCPGVAVVIATLRHLDERLSRRLQLAAESSGAIGLILRPAHPRIKSFAAVQMLVEGARRRRDIGTEGRSSRGIEGSRERGIKGSRDGGTQGRRGEGTEGRRDTGTEGRRDGALAPPNRSPTPSFGRDGAPTDEIYLCRITLLKVREGMPAEPLLVDLHHEAGALPVHALSIERSSAKRA
ncbi:MAG: hypothetical protein IH989_01320 [Planctomycetes bacterium]|nr:hypothetical protein [Planctomycetota bacterium]